MGASIDAGETVAAHINEVRLVGELAACEMRKLPSGDQLLAFRLTVRRRPPARPKVADGAPGRRVPTVDAIACVAASARVAKTVQQCPIGEVLEIGGSIQRRFWRSPVGPASAYQVQALSARRIRAAATRRRKRDAAEHGQRSSA